MAFSDQLNPGLDLDDDSEERARGFLAAMRQRRERAVSAAAAALPPDVVESVGEEIAGLSQIAASTLADAARDDESRGYGAGAAVREHDAVSGAGDERHESGGSAEGLGSAGSSDGSSPDGSAPDDRTDEGFRLAHDDAPRGRHAFRDAQVLADPHD